MNANVGLAAIAILRFGFTFYLVVVEQSYPDLSVEPAATKTEGGPPSEEDCTQSKWRQAALERHNFHRRNHGAPDLVLDQDVCIMAQKTAEYLASKKLMAHVSKKVFGHKYGENLATTFIDDMSEAAVDAVNRWYDEVSMYSYENPGFSGQTGHFTQLVWKESTKLGMGYAKKDDFAIVVGQYSPHGNMHGDFPNNVKPKNA